MKLLLVNKGGKGSGHHGHVGRRGEVGGSIPGKGTNAPKEKVLSSEITPYGHTWRSLNNLSKDTKFYIIDKGKLSKGKLPQAATMRTEYVRLVKSFPKLPASDISEVHLQPENENKGEKFAEGVTGLTIPMFGVINIHASDDAPDSGDYVLGRKGKKGQTGVVDPSLLGAFRHEIGHMVAYSKKQAFTKFKGIVTKLGRKNLGKTISTYGSAQGADELFAEAFSAFTHNNYSGDLPREVDNFFRRMFR